jgi:hypothetical protein
MLAPKTSIVKNRTSHRSDVSWRLACMVHRSTIMTYAVQTSSRKVCETSYEFEGCFAGVGI